MCRYTISFLHIRTHFIAACSRPFDTFRNIIIHAIPSTSRGTFEVYRKGKYIRKGMKNLQYSAHLLVLRCITLLYLLFVIITKCVTSRFKVENSSFSTTFLIHSRKILRPTWKRRSKLSRWEMAKSKMEYFVGERDLSKDISPLYVHAQWWLVSLRLRWRREFSAKRGGEERSHRKPNTMVIRGESASALPVPSAVERRSDPVTPASSRAFYPPVARHWKFIELPSPLSTSSTPPPSFFSLSPFIALSTWSETGFSIS